MILPDVHEYRIGTNIPSEVVEFINESHPEIKGLCYFDADKGCLMSRDRTRARFYFDPFHRVVEITILQQ
jgi:hypothetical protein